MKDVLKILDNLQTSDFRRNIRLSKRETEYLNSKGLETVLQHAADFITKRLAPAEPVNDGKQTPRRNHPVFVAQHATAPVAAVVLPNGTVLRRGGNCPKRKNNT